MSFCADEHCGAGKLLATEKGIVATSLFTKTVVDFEAQPELTSGKMYFLHVVLERGAFKFQACRGTKYPTYSYFGSNDKVRGRGRGRGSLGAAVPTVSTASYATCCSNVGLC